MIGFIYFIVVAAIAIVSSIEYHELRKKSRDDAIKRGHFDYVDYKGKQWYGDRRAAYMYKDGHECLVDLKDPDIVYIDITKQKEIEDAKNPITISQKKDAEKELFRCCGSIEAIGGYTRQETETGNFFILEKDFDNYYIQPRKKVDTQNIYIDQGSRQVISKERYDFLNGTGWSIDTKDRFLARKKYMDENQIFQKCGYKEQKAYRIDLTKDPEKKGYLPTKVVFLCATNLEEAKQRFMNDWYQYCKCVLLDSITVTEIGV